MEHIIELHRLHENETALIYLNVEEDIANFYSADFDWRVDDYTVVTPTIIELKDGRSFLAKETYKEVEDIINQKPTKENNYQLNLNLEELQYITKTVNSFLDSLLDITNVKDDVVTLNKDEWVQKTFSQEELQEEYDLIKGIKQKIKSSIEENK